MNHFQIILLSFAKTYVFGFVLTYCQLCGLHPRIRSQLHMLLVTPCLWPETGSGGRIYTMETDVRLCCFLESRLWTLKSDRENINNAD